MATNPQQNLPPVPYNTPVTQAGGLLTAPWVAWFRQLFFRVGENTASSITQLLVNPMTAVGDLITGGASGAPARVAGTLSTTKQFLTQSGNGSQAGTPTWGTIQVSDVPTLNQSTTGSAASFTGNLSGDVTSMGMATSVASVGGSSAGAVHAAELLANAATSAASASTLMKRDANANVAINNFNEAFVTTVTAAGTTTLTVASAPLQQFTGTTTQSVSLPAANTLPAGCQYYIFNRSSGSVTIKDGSGAILQVIAGGGQCCLTCAGNGTLAGTWDTTYTYTGTLPLSLGGTGATTQQAAMNALAGTQSAGKYLRSDGTNTTLSSFPSSDIGSGSATNGQALLANGSGGVSWGTAVSNLSVVSKTASYTLTPTDDVVLGSSSSAAFTLTLPTAIGNSGKTFRMVKTDSSFNAITIATSASQTIGGAASKSLNTQNEVWTLVSDGSNWQILDHKCTTPWSSYTPALGGVTATIEYSQWRRLGDTIQIRGTAVASAVTASALTVGYPSGLSAVNVNTTSSNAVLTGSFESDYAGATQAGVFPLYGSSTAIAFGKNNSANGFVQIAANNVLSSTSRFSWTAETNVSGWSD